MRILTYIISLTSIVCYISTKAISSDDFSSLIELSIERVYNDSGTPTVLATVTNNAKFKMSLVIVVQEESTNIVMDLYNKIIINDKNNIIALTK